MNDESSGRAIFKARTNPSDWNTGVPLGKGHQYTAGYPLSSPPPLFSIVLGFLLEFVGIHLTEKRHCKRKESSPGTCKHDNDVTRVKTWTWRSRAWHTNY